MNRPQQSPQLPLSPTNPNEKPRLTAEQRKANHITSEHKRRFGIREAFDQLADLTPGMAKRGRQEALVLAAFNVEMRKELADRWRNLEELRRRGQDTSAYELDPETMRLAQEFAELEDAQTGGPNGRT